MPCGCGAAPAEADLGSVAVGPPPRRRSRAGRGWLDEIAAAVSTPSIWSVVRMPVVLVPELLRVACAVGLRACD